MSKPQKLHEIISTGLILNPANYALNQLNRELNNFLDLEDKNFSTIGEITRILKKDSLNNFVHLSSGFQESNIAIALNCGNGMVAKIIPSEYSDKLPDITNIGFGRAPFLLPSFKSSDVKANNPVTSFKIKYYPYIRNADVSREDIDKFKRAIEPFGLEVIKKDDRPINFRKLNDKNSTVTAVDADMLAITDADKFNKSGPAINKWIEHLEKIYPIYLTKEIPAQDEKFHFNYAKELSTNAGKLISFNIESEQKTAEQKNISNSKKKSVYFGWLGL